VKRRIGPCAINPRECEKASGDERMPLVTAFTWTFWIANLGVGAYPAGAEPSKRLVERHRARIDKSSTCPATRSSRTTIPAS